MILFDTFHRHIEVRTRIMAEILSQKDHYLELFRQHHLPINGFEEDIINFKSINN